MGIKFKNKGIDYFLKRIKENGIALKFLENQTKTFEITFSPTCSLKKVLESPRR